MSILDGIKWYRKSKGGYWFLTRNFVAGGGLRWWWYPPYTHVSTVKTMRSHALKSEDYTA